MSSSGIASCCVALVADLVTQAGAPQVTGLAIGLGLTVFGGFAGWVGAFPFLVQTPMGFDPLVCGVKEPGFFITKGGSRLEAFPFALGN